MSDWNGLPENPASDGWHWMLVTHGIGHAFPMLWDASGKMWDAGDAGWTLAEDIATRWRYLGPCLTPADLAAERAAAAEAMREACAADLDAQAAYCAGVAKNLTGQNRINFEHYAVLHRGSANDIRAILIPSASALAERDERMREEGRREERDIIWAEIERAWQRLTTCSTSSARGRRGSHDR